MKTSIVVGLNFGDEGKGLVTAWLAKRGDLVVRFSGGHQAGHTVVKDGYRHVFSSIGAGTLNGADTYWSEYCTFYPKAFLNEYKSLRSYGFMPKFFIHPLAAVTTPFDVRYNQALEMNRNAHGSVGVGFGTTIERHTTTPLKLHAQDLLYKDMFLHKLQGIRDYYANKAVTENLGIYFKDLDTDAIMEEYVQMIDCLDGFTVSPLATIKHYYDHIIFEGSQGIMLDMDHGFFPNVTRANTTCKNAMQIIAENQLAMPEIYYVTRAYLTRHGNGFIPNVSENMQLINNEQETNITNQFQGNFRKGHHSLDMFRHAIDCDAIYSGYDFSKKQLVITCLDQTDGKVYCEQDALSASAFAKSIDRKFRSVYLNCCAYGDLKLMKS